MNKLFSRKKYFTFKNALIMVVSAAVSASLLSFILFGLLAQKPSLDFASIKSKIISPLWNRGGVQKNESGQIVWRVAMGGQNGSGQVGTASFYNEKGFIRVILDLKSGPSGVAQPAHIYSGSCVAVGPNQFDLQNVVNGQSVTELQVSQESLKSMLPVAVAVYKSVEEYRTLGSCGSLK